MTLKPFVSYDPVAMALHWLIALAIFIMFVTALAMGAPNGSFDPETRMAIYATHKTTGFSILLIMLFRMFWGHFHPAPLLPLRRFPQWQAIAARFVHDALYVLAIVTPFIGWSLISIGSHPLNFFGLISIPPLPYLDYFAGSPEFRQFAGELHETLATILACLLVVHTGATFLHHFVDRDEILLRITPKAIHPFLEKLRGK